MAKKSKVNKAATIRDYAKEHPDEKASAIAKALNEQGLGVTPQQVSTTLSNERKKLGIKVKGRRKSKAKKAIVRTSSSAVGVDELVKAKKLADQLGGISKAKAALEALSRIVD